MINNTSTQPRQNTPGVKGNGEWTVGLQGEPTLAGPLDNTRLAPRSLITEASTARAEKFLAAWGDLPDDADTDDRTQAVRDVLTDLRHFAFTHEINFRSIADESYDTHMMERAEDRI